MLEAKSLGAVQKSPASKAVAVLTRGAYALYVSTAKGRERRWRLFSTAPVWENQLIAGVRTSQGWNEKVIMAPQGKIMRYGLLGIVLGASIWGCSRDHHDHPELTTGEQLFNYHCAECHGTDGTGLLFDVMPANILTKKTQEGVVEYVTHDTNHERKMPVFKTMPRAEARKIAAHLMKLKHQYETAKRRKPRQLLIEP